MIIIEKLKIIYKNIQAKKANKLKANRIKKYLQNQQVPWSEGYQDFKQQTIEKNINDNSLLNQLSNKKLPNNYGFRLDERIVEYAWIFAHLKKEKTIFLDAGSTFNFDYLLNHPIIQNKEKYIYTYYPETPSFYEKRISYIYGDLRELPFKNDYFEEIVCQSTIEHIDMNNSIYGYDLAPIQKEITQKSYEYLKVISEIIRVLKPNGTLLLTFPYGKFENHGFFQQLDKEMLDRILEEFAKYGIYQNTFFNYLSTGWVFSTQIDCDNAESYNPHTGNGKKEDGAAHSRAICCINFTKN
jgi:SAM-dependent methyltransferase